MNERKKNKKQGGEIMELIFILPFMLLTGWMIGKQLNNNDIDNKNKITKVGDKTWIVGNV